jgi:hypothetical protein
MFLNKKTFKQKVLGARIIQNAAEKPDGFQNEITQ